MTIAGGLSFWASWILHFGANRIILPKDFWYVTLASGSACPPRRAAGECPSLAPLQSIAPHSRFAGGTVLQADTRANGQTHTMNDVWKQWEGQVADGRFPLRQFLGGTEHGPVFLTESGEAEAQREAIKLVLAGPQASDAQLARWGQASGLSHPHLLRIFGTGRCEVGGARMVYAVMERADEDLSQVVPVRPLSAAETGEMLRPVLEALAYLHGKGLVHGHVKPSNIMAVGEELKISSDGVCAAREIAIGRAKPSAYDAPEAGTRGGSAAGDVWSLGVTLVEVLAQKLPAWEWKGQEEPELPRMPAPFGDIARQCLRRDPQQRCTLAEIAARLDPDAPPLGKLQAVAAKAVAPSLPPAPAVPKPAPATKAAAPAASGSEFSAKKLPSRVVAPAVAVVVVLAIAVFGVFKVSSRGSAADTSADKGVAGTEPRPTPTPESKPAATSVPTPVAAPAAPRAPAPKAIAKGVAVAGVGGGVAHQVMPDVPRSASSTIRGAVRVAVRAKVDASGKVTGESLESAGPSKYFANLAEKAARNWEFLPPMADGQATSSEWIVRFEFAQDGTKATATRADR
jgi:TonB family protein